MIVLWECVLDCFDTVKPANGVRRDDDSQKHSYVTSTQYHSDTFIWKVEAELLEQHEKDNGVPYIWHGQTGLVVSFNPVWCIQSRSVT